MTTAVLHDEQPWPDESREGPGGLLRRPWLPAIAALVIAIVAAVVAVVALATQPTGIDRYAPTPAVVAPAEVEPAPPSAITPSAPAVDCRGHRIGTAC